MSVVRPYPPSWINRFHGWVDSLRIQPFLFYVLIYLVGLLLMHLAFWADGSLPAGELHSLFFFDMIWVPIGLGFLHLLSKVAAESIDEFRPGIKASKTEFETLRYRFVTLPFWPALALTVLGFAASLTVSSAATLLSQTSLSRVAWSLLAGAGYTFLPIWFYAAYRLIAQINQLYGKVEQVNLFNLQPFYGLARVAMVLGGFAVLMANINYVWESFLGTVTMSVQAIIATYIVCLVIAVLVVLLPLWGIHRHIQDEKRDLLATNAKQITDLHKAIQAAVDKKKFTNMDGMEKALTALFTMRTAIQDVPAWPWRPGAFRNFASAVLLPLVLWVAERLLSQYF